jgi:deoxyadenosine/deoxycytidine kinase
MTDFTILVEGNIASGKTSFLKVFEEVQNFEVLHEPLNKWQNVNGQDLLKSYYENTEKYGFIFQNYVLLTQFEQFKNLNKRFRIIERSPLSGKYCFFELIKEKLSPLESSVLAENFDIILNTPWMKKIDLIVYLRCTPETAYKRLKLRDRDSENSVSLELMAKLHELHENWLNKELSNVPAPVLIINADQNLTKVVSKAKNLIDLAKLNKLQFYLPG